MKIPLTSAKVAVVKVKIDNKMVDATVNQKTGLGRLMSKIRGIFNPILGTTSEQQSSYIKLTWKDSNGQDQSKNLSLALKLDPDNFKHIDTTQLSDKTEPIMHEFVKDQAQVNDSMRDELTSLVQKTLDSNIKNTP